MKSRKKLAIFGEFLYCNVVLKITRDFESDKSTSTPENDRFYIFKFFKTFVKVGIKNWFFFVLTSLLIFCLLIVSFVAELRISRKKIEAGMDDWSYQLQDIYLLSPKRQEKVLKEINMEVSNALSNLAYITDSEEDLEKFLNKMEEVAKKWLVSIDKLSDYTFTNSGLVVKGSEDRYFTDDLENFFSNEELHQQTKELVSQLQKYNYFLIKIGQGSLFKKFNLYWDFISKIWDKQDSILQVLGHFNTQNLVIFNQDLNEKRPTGGLLDAYFLIKIDKGRFRIGDVRYINKSYQDHLYDHPAVSYYNFFGSGLLYSNGVQNINYSPCFKTVGQTLVAYMKEKKELEVDQVIFVSSQFFENISKTGLKVKNSTTVRSEVDSQISIVLENTIVELVNRFELKKAVISLFSELGKIKFDEAIKLLTMNYLTRDLQLYFADEELENAFQISQTQTCQSINEDNLITPLVIDLDYPAKKEQEHAFNIWFETVNGKTKFHLKHKIIYEFEDGEDHLYFVGLQVPKTAEKLEFSSNNIINIDIVRTTLSQNFIDLQRVKNPSIKNLKNLKYDQRAYSYIQNDGSLVFGGYVNNQSDETVIDYSFTLPSNNNKIKFYGQSGLKKVSLSLGHGLFFEKAVRQKRLLNKSIIQGGVEINIVD